MKLEDIRKEMEEWNPSWRGEDMAVWADKYGKKLLAVAEAAKNTWLYHDVLSDDHILVKALDALEREE